MQRVERQIGENEASRRRIERLDGQVTRLAECYGTLAATLARTPEVMRRYGRESDSGPSH